MGKTKLFFIIFLLIATTTFSQMKNPRKIPFIWRTDTTKSEIDLSELTIVLPRGSFPVLNSPKFTGKLEGLTSFFPKEPVIAVEINGRAKAYPLNMLSTHEIANDTLQDLPILITFCPLCNSGIVYDRRLNFKGEQYFLEFEVSGMLRKSDMVMADRQTESWWQQLMGRAIVGELAGAQLTIVPSIVISVEDFFTRYPDGKILSKNTGIKNAESSYGINYYKNYDRPDGKPYDRFFDPDQIDKRLPAMERVIDIRSDETFKIYPFSIIAEKGVLNDEFNSKHVVLFHQPGTISVLDEKDISKSNDIGSVTAFSSIIDGRVLTFRKVAKIFMDNETNSTWDITGRCIEGALAGRQLLIERHGIHFAFAWLAFHPDTEIYKYRHLKN